MSRIVSARPPARGSVERAAPPPARPISIIVTALSPKDIARARARAPVDKPAEPEWNPRFQQGKRPSAAVAKGRGKK